MYRNQYEYDNAEQQGPSLREIAEERVVSLLDKGDEKTIGELGEHLALWLSDEANDLLEFLATCGPSKFRRIISAVADIDAQAALALHKLNDYADKARAEFITEKAEEMLKEAAE